MSTTRPTTDALGDLRDGTVGTLTIVGVLTLLFQAELLAAAAAGEPAPADLFAPLAPPTKILIGVLGGPLLHLTASHLVGNLGVLLLAGGYVELGYGRRSLYRFFLVDGYIAGWTALVGTFLLGGGSVGGVGASGATVGLRVWVTVHAADRLVGMVLDGGLDRRLWHLAPLVFGLAGVLSLAATLTGVGPLRAGDLTHLVGALLGAAWGFVAAVRRSGA